MTLDHCITHCPDPGSSFRILEADDINIALLTCRMRDLHDLRAYLRDRAYAGVYVLSGTIADEPCVYIGEGSVLWRRLLTHAREPSLSFVREIHLLCAPTFDKAAVLFLQEQLTDRAALCGRVRRIGHRPERLAVPHFRRRALERQLGYGLDLMTLAGVDMFDPPQGSVEPRGMGL